MVNYKLYIHTNKTNMKRYVGITSHRNPKQRWGTGGEKYKGSTRFWNAIQKHGWDNFEHEILLTNLSKEEAEDREQFYISLFRTTDDRFGYNISKGGKSNYQGKNSNTNEYDRKRYHDNPDVKEKKKALAKAYYEAHKEKVKAYRKAYRLSHLEEERQHHKAWKERVKNQCIMDMINM